MNILLSICIPTYNRCEKLINTLTNLFEIIDEIDHKSIEIVVSDNNSIDNTSESIKLFEDKISYYKQRSNLGYDGNVKFLYSVANGEYIFFLADDDEIIGEKFKELYETILINKRSNIECFIVNFLEGNNVIDRFNYIEANGNIVTMKDLGENFYKPFVFLSGFILRNKKIDMESISLGTYFIQMDIALSSLYEDSKIYIYRDIVVKRIIPHYEDETGCNIMDDTWKIYLGSAKVRRKHDCKFNVKSPYFLEINQAIAFSRNYFKLPNKSLLKKFKLSMLAVIKIENRYKSRVLFVPLLLLYKIFKKCTKGFMSK